MVDFVNWIIRQKNHLILESRPGYFKTREHPLKILKKGQFGNDKNLKKMII